jgi:uncharacterized protein
MSSRPIAILHGIQGFPGIHWQGWLGENLAELGHVSYLPDFPCPENPNRHAWLDDFGAKVGSIDPADLVIIGHSLGAVTALDFISRSVAPVKTFVAVSGFARDYDSEITRDFMKTESIDFDAVRANVGQSFVFFGDDDPYVPQSELQHLADQLDVVPTVIKGGGHLNSDSGYSEFPKLLETISSLG